MIRGLQVETVSGARINKTTSFHTPIFFHCESSFQVYLSDVRM